MTQKLTARAIRAMPYAIRLHHYNEEKNVLFFRFRNMTQAEKDEATRDLARKWRV